MVVLQTIFNGSLSPSTISVSQTFTNGQFLIFTTPTYDSNEGIYIGFSVFMNVQIGLQVIQKDLVLPSREFQGTLSSYSIIDIPREYSESGYVLQCAFNSSIPVSDFVVYAVTSSVTQESISNQINQNAQTLSDILGVLADIQSDVLTIKTQVQALYNLLQIVEGAVQVLLPEVATVVQVLNGVQQTVNLLEGSNETTRSYLANMVAL